MTMSIGRGFWRALTDREIRGVDGIGKGGGRGGCCKRDLGRSQLCKLLWTSVFQSATVMATMESGGSTVMVMEQDNRYRLARVITETQQQKSVTVCMSYV